MADIRIKDLATTAASTASDDFVAVDGSANGTRKLNAYSPTFGGNLTVSGTGTSSVAGNFLIGTTTDLNRLTVVKDAAGSDLGAGEGQVMIAGATNTNKRLAIGFNTTSDYGWLQAGIAGTAYKNIVLNNNGGNILLGKTIDSGNGKLQLATHTTSAGGIGFGTDSSIYRVSAFSIALKGNAAKILFVYNDSVSSGIVDTADAGAGYSGLLLNNTAKSATLVSNGTTALTLDSSQNATFAGNITVNGAGPYTLKSRTIINRSDNTSATFGHVSLTRGTGAGTTAALATTGDASNGVASVSLQLSDADRFVVTSAGTVVLGTQASLATNATDGFTYIPVSAGAPTGTPTAYTGKVAMEYDTTNNKLYIYNGGWKSVTLA